MPLRHYLMKICCCICGLALFGALGSITASDAATFYVAPNGSDSNSGTESQPFRTLNKGVKALKAGDTLLVRGGTYKETLIDVIPSGTSWSSPVSVRAAQGEQVIMKAPAAGDVLLAFLKTDTKYIIIDGFILDADNLSSFAVYIAEGAERIRIMNSEIKNARNSGILVSAGQFDGTKWGCCNEFINLDVHNNGKDKFSHGLYVTTTNNIIEYSRFYQNSGYGIHVYHSWGGVNKNIIRYNQVYDNNTDSSSGGGIIVASGSESLVYNNIIWKNRHGLFVSSPRSRIYNNTIYDNNKWGDGIGIVLQNDKSGVVIRNNIIYNNKDMSIYGINSGVTLTNNLLDVDPKFLEASTGDFRLQVGSPAIDTGIALSEVPDDFAGILRPQGSGYDIGAYEYRVVLNRLLPPTNLRITEKP